MSLQEEISRRRTFAIISHPDAGKTTLTEKLLLFGGAIHIAGAVKSNKIKKTATSDWMEIEKQRGISVATSVMGFNYGDYKINILDTPGHLCRGHISYANSCRQRYHSCGRCQRCGATDSQAHGSVPNEKHSCDYIREQT